MMSKTKVILNSIPHTQSLLMMYFQPSNSFMFMSVDDLSEFFLLVYQNTYNSGIKALYNHVSTVSVPFHNTTDFEHTYAPLCIGIDVKQRILSKRLLEDTVLPYCACAPNQFRPDHQPDMKNFLFFMPGYDGNALNRNYLNLVNKGVENYTIVQSGEYMEAKEGRDSRTLCLLLTFF